MARWQKGQSGNPSGRPKLTPDYEGVRALAREAAPDAINVLVAIMNDPDAPPNARASAAEAVLSRAFGRPELHVLSAHSVVDYRETLRSVAQRLRMDTLPAVPVVEDKSGT